MKEGWTYKKLGEVGITQTGTTPSKSNPNNYGNYIPFIRPAEISIDGSGHINYDSEIKLSEEGLKNGRLFKKGATLMVCIGSIGKLGYAERNISCNQQINVITPFDEYYPKYIFYAMSSPAFQKECLKIAQGAQATLPIINKGKWSNLLISIPSSREEQQRIVSRLDSAFAHIDELKANAEKQLSEARALFQKALTKAMEPKEGWEEKMLGDVCEIFGRIGFRGYTTKDLVPSAEEGAISLSPSNIQDGKMDYSKCTYISWFKYEESPEIKIFDGDILLVKTGSSYGKSALVENLPHAATINPQSVVLKNMKINTRFFAYQLRTYRVRDEFDKFVSGTAIPTFSQAKLSTVSIYFPSEEEQQRIVSRLDSLSAHVRELEEVLQKTIAECDALKQALLRKVFE